MTELPVVWLHPDGRRVPGRIAIGVPELVSEGEARCEVVLDGMQPATRVSGQEPLQALVAAVRFAGIRLWDFRNMGGRVLYRSDVDECDIPLDVIFGPLLRMDF